MTGLAWSGLVIGLVLSLIGWVLVAPMALMIDTEKPRCAFRWRGLITARLVAGGRIHLWVFGYTRVLDPWKSTKFVPRAPSPRRRPARRPKRKSPSWRRMLRITWAVGRTFRLRTCQVDLDTGDYVLNAYLYPVFTRLTGRNCRLRVGFNGKTQIQIVLENRLYRMLFAFFRTYVSP